jgi:diadenosine tetraphosphate (Ap4A) HIT family hydrolase
MIGNQARPILVKQLAVERPFSLDPQLDADTVPVGDLPLCRILLNDDANYPWLILVPRRAAAVELIDLAEAERSQLMQEIAQVSGALKSVTACDKLNVAALGNVVAQLHVHIIARRTTDVAWPKPVWNVAPRRPYGAAERTRLIKTLRAALRIAS